MSYFLPLNETENNFEEKRQLSDYQLAIQLQEQFENETHTENPGISLTYSKKSETNNSEKSLVDPSWEIIDPTPNIHELFVAFNERFFWNNLLSVCVSWSNRMTSCAGICSFQGRSGMCSITLSAPLLKLRPRSDLVETLLHEMIHAYLFVTHNTRDREGHGPEFHKHMYRINKEAGTRITVYHSFHDEVRLYKQHWWKCNGPCQNRKPYFGLVKRAMNRAPGPNDLWWAEHMRQCGGSFIKIKEPEKPNKQSNKKTAKVIKKETSKSKDITNYFPKSNEVNSSKIVVNNILHSSNIDSDNKISTNKSSTTVSNMNNDDYSKCRNYWLNKYSDNNTKRPLLETNNFEKKTKIPKLSQISSSRKVVTYIPENEDDLPGLKKCFICGQNILDEFFERHVMMCAENTYDFDEINIPKTNVSKTTNTFIDLTKDENSMMIEELDAHTEQCLLVLFDNLEQKYNAENEGNIQK